MYKKELKRGSMWLKWDCHLHTPISYENNFENMDTYINALKDKATQHEIDVIVINDYFTMDGYKKVVEFCTRDSENEAYKLQINDEKYVYILPGMELRVDNFTSKENSLNVHIFFNQCIDADLIQKRFLNELKINFEGMELTCDRDTLIKIGYSKMNKKQYDESFNISSIKLDVQEKYLKSALSVISVSFDNINKACDKFKSRFRTNESLAENCMLIVSAFSGHGSISEITWDQGRATNIKHQVLYCADICFTANANDIKFLLGKHPKTKPEEIKGLFRNLKPCIWGSDSHEEETICHPSRGDSYKYTWIKGMPNFDGLKQVIFEPDSRVKIQENNPNNKTDYMTIDKVKFIDKSESNLFTDEEILFNDDLNTIIGGKSSGKSLLLSHIAQTINGDVEDFSKYDSLRSKYYYDFEVYWKDGQVNKISEEIEKKKRKVKYIHQMYVNHLAEDKGTKLKDTILEIILENNSIKNEYILYKKNNEEIGKNLNNVTYELNNDLNSFSEKQREIKEIGDLAGIKNEIEKINNSISELLKDSVLSEEEQIKYDELNNLIALNNQEIFDVNEKIIPEIISYKNYFEGLKCTILQEIKNKISISKNRLDNKYEQALGDILTNQEELEGYFSNVIKKLGLKETLYGVTLNNLNTSNASLKAEIKHYTDKLRNQTQISNLKKELETQITKQSRIENLIKERYIVVENVKSKIASIEELLNKRIDEHRKFIAALNREDVKCISNNLNLRSNILINEGRFKDSLGAILNRSSKSTTDLLNTSINERNYIEFIKNNIVAVINNSSKYQFKANKNRLDFIYTLINDYVEFNVTIMEMDDEFSVMSPGKQGLVLLKLLLHLSNEKFPILLDQPEDNLDNRTISSELKDFIKEKKIERQIIMVTHNANLTVLADSDEIIVANQSGSQIDKENKTYRFEYVTGPLEFSFINEDEKGVLFKKGIKEHVCEILEGGKEAFKQRENKYGF